MVRYLIERSIYSFLAKPFSSFPEERKIFVLFIISLRSKDLDFKTDGPAAEEQVYPSRQLSSLIRFGANELIS